MYMGNMYEFVNKVQIYLKENNIDLYISLENCTSHTTHKDGKSSERKFFILYMRRGTTSLPFEEIVDSEDFEEQVYKIVNKYIT